MSGSRGTECQSRAIQWDEVGDIGQVQHEESGNERYAVPAPENNVLLLGYSATTSYIFEMKRSEIELAQGQMLRNVKKGDQLDQLQ